VLGVYSQGMFSNVTEGEGKHPLGGVDKTLFMSSLCNSESRIGRNGE